MPEPATAVFPKVLSRWNRLLRVMWPTSILLAFVPLADPAYSAEPSLTVQGEGFASKAGAGQFTARLPDGSVCTAFFSGGKISLFGQSATKAKATCTNGTTTQSVSAVVSRKLNGLPREATLTFNDGTKVLVVFPREAVTRPAQ